MKTPFPKKHYHTPKYFIIDANKKILGRLSVLASKLLMGKENTFYTPGINQGNYVIIINTNKIEVSGKKKEQKLYYSNSQRPGNLKIESYKHLKERIASRILEKAIRGMLPKGPLGREYYKRLYTFSENIIYNLKKNKHKIPLDLIQYIQKNE